MLRLTIVAVLSLLASGARAEIWSWQDADGVRRFTNRADSIPDSERDQAKVVLTEPPVAAAEAPVVAPRKAPERSEKVRRLAEIVYQRSTSQEYAEELLDQMQSNRRRPAALPVGEPEQRPAAPVVVVPPVLRPRIARFSPLVSSGFDAGRERHVTMRMRLQDQFRLQSCRNDPADWIYSWTTSYRSLGRESPPLRSGSKR